MAHSLLLFFAARPGNTICSSAMAETVLTVFPSLSEIGRTSCTTSKIIFVRLCSSFAIPRAPEIRLIFGVFVYTEQASRPACRALALPACALFYTVLFQRCLAPGSHRRARPGGPHRNGDEGWPQTSSGEGAVPTSGTFSGGMSLEDGVPIK